MVGVYGSVLLILDMADLHVHTFPRSLKELLGKECTKNLKLRGIVTGAMGRL
jgi:hypothetical protein